MQLTILSGPAKSIEVHGLQGVTIGVTQLSFEELPQIANQRSKNTKRKAGCQAREALTAAAYFF
jgi:hypothetical protein